MQQYDIIIAGSGAAGLSLAWYLSHSAWMENRSVLLLDKSSKTRNDRTWGFWTDKPTTFDDYVSWTFNEAEFVSRYYEATLSLGPYRYQVLEGKRFYEAVKERLRHFPQIHFRQEEILELKSYEDSAEVRTDKGTYAAAYVFNSCFIEKDLQQAARQGLYLQQHFKGWVISTPEQTFLPDKVRLFDFRTPQLNAMRFFYLIPHSPEQALVEYTLFSPELLRPEEYDRALKTYIQEVLGLTAYEVLEEEWGVIPMTTYRFPARKGKRIVNIGSAGGASKPSTGYTFLRIQQHCQELVRQLEEHEQPTATINSSGRFSLYDAMLLNIMKQRGDKSEEIFSELFRNNPVQRILKFLDEETHPGEELLIMNSVPRGLFINSFLNLQLSIPFA